MYCIILVFCIVAGIDDDHNSPSPKKAHKLGMYVYHTFLLAHYFVISAAGKDMVSYKKKMKKHRQGIQNTAHVTLLDLNPHLLISFR